MGTWENNQLTRQHGICSCAVLPFAGGQPPCKAQKHSSFENKGRRKGRATETSSKTAGRASKVGSKSTGEASGSTRRKACQGGIKGTGKAGGLGMFQPNHSIHSYHMGVSDARG